MKEHYENCYLSRRLVSTAVRTGSWVRKGGHYNCVWPVWEARPTLDNTTLTEPPIVIAPNTAWASALPGSSWVSFGLTGDTSNPGFFVVPNGTVVSFFDVFNVPGTPTGGTLTVMADDSATVLLNGVVLMAEATSVGNNYATCSDFGIGCVRPTVLDLPASLLQTGSNTLEFEVAQRAGSSFGLDYAGSVIDPLPRARVRLRNITDTWPADAGLGCVGQPPREPGPGSDCFRLDVRPDRRFHRLPAN